MFQIAYVERYAAHCLTAELTLFAVLIMVCSAPTAFAYAHLLTAIAMCFISASQTELVIHT